VSSRFIAHVERPDGRVHHIDCDAAHENDAGRLALTLNTYIGAVAAYAPGAWASYRLEPTPDASDLRPGPCTLNEWRAQQGIDPVPETPEQGWPAIGDKVHVWLADEGCWPGTVEGHITDAVSGGNTVGLSINLDQPAGQFKLRFSKVFDPTVQAEGSWHWPHDDEQPATPMPDAPAPVTVNVHIDGSVLSEKNLQDAIASQLGRIAAQRGLRF
jgi:hypothetical protein